jgi:hypothetical protein
MWDELRREQAADPECQHFIANSHADSIFDHKEHGTLIRKAPVHGSLQVVVPAPLRPNILHMEHFPERRLYFNYPGDLHQIA